MGEVGRIVETLEENAEFHKSVQPTLRAFVTDRNYPLVTRFEVWSKWCNKKHESWIIGANAYGYVGKMFRSCEPYDYDRYRTYTWEEFLDYAKEGIEGNESWADFTMEEFMESLIQTNFGSFYYDW